MGKEYEVTIREVSELTVRITAESREMAEDIAERNWKNCEYIIGPDEFVGADFKARECRRSRELER